MAKAVANNTSAAFIRVVGSEFVQKYLGEGPRMVRDVFRLAREGEAFLVLRPQVKLFGRMHLLSFLLMKSMQLPPSDLMLRLERIEKYNVSF